MSDAAQAADDNPYLREPPTVFEPVGELGAETAREQAEHLREAIRFHDQRYYVEADPVIDDRTYDDLFERLQELEAAFDLDTSNSPTNRVGGEPLDELDTVEHVAPMLSIDSSGDPDEVREFDRRVRDGLADADPDAEVAYVLEPKFDGISVELVYRDGELERAASRGDGHEGDDITANVRTVGSIPQRLRGDHPEYLAVRGELFMPREPFSAYNSERVAEGKEPFANPRNAVAGTVRQLDPSTVAERPLDCFFFDVLESSADFETHIEQVRRLPEWGLKTSAKVERVDDIEAALDYRDRLLAERDDLSYEVDGTVIKLDDLAACEALGATSRAPRWAYAYKFPARSEETTVRQIAVQVGRTGRLTPVAMLDPVEVGGVTVSRATLHNPDQIADLGVDVGDRVRIQRAGDVIPYVEEVTESASEGHFVFPDHCPACDSAVERDGPNAFCTGGLACPAQLQRAVQHYAARSGLDIEGLGEKMVQQLIDEGLVAGIPDLYDLTVEELAELEGWGETSAENLVAELEAASEPPLADFLAAIGVPEVGETTAANLARHFGTLDAVMEASTEELEAVDDVGPIVAEEIYEFFRSERNREVVDALRERGVEPQAAETETGDELEGLTFVFTGSLDGYTRSEAQELVERHGGNATSSVSGNTDYLVAGSNPGQSKQDDAAANDVPVVDQGEFEDLLAERGVELDE
ncbi:NAD-dependent DNA ligase LigA [Haloglomus litoreum]|uniref:NAD-dependent DNA ligase LigA n=1 Tax=Haloglomus litoreum TaxID=3034026 RepID=UPI0023E847F7|nr:NAD-dependent DNA ligase LigA [Haloglomus sp. DT116]